VLRTELKTEKVKLYFDKIADSLSKTFPELGQVDSVEVLGDGFRSLVVETPHGEVFKLARNWDGAAGYLKEREILPELRQRLPVPVPYPVWSDGPSQHFPFGVIGYPKIEGSPLCQAQEDDTLLACDVARFMLSLHSIEITPDLARMVPQPRAHWDELARLHNTLAPPLREFLSPEEYRVIRAWWTSFLADPEMHSYTPVLHHGDFWGDNMLIDIETRRLTGIVDFEHVAAGDPAQDIATLLHLGRAFTLDVLESYASGGGILDENLLYRAQRLWELREFTGIGFAVRSTSQAQFDIAVKKLRNGPLLNDRTRKETSLWPPQQR
jgi:aminoglycoside phosphotransferase (APT) family kinase protein